MEGLEPEFCSGIEACNSYQCHNPFLPILNHLILIFLPMVCNHFIPMLHSCKSKLQSQHGTAEVCSMPLALRLRHCPRRHRLWRLSQRCLRCICFGMYWSPDHVPSNARCNAYTCTVYMYVYNAIIYDMCTCAGYVAPCACRWVNITSQNPLVTIICTYLHRVQTWHGRNPLSPRPLSRRHPRP